MATHGNLFTKITQFEVGVDGSNVQKYNGIVYTEIYKFNVNSRWTFKHCTSYLREMRKQLHQDVRDVTLLSSVSLELRATLLVCASLVVCATFVKASIIGYLINWLHRIAVARFNSKLQSFLERPQHF